MNQYLQESKKLKKDNERLNKQLDELEALIN